jgi:hypothetical protein
VMRTVETLGDRVDREIVAWLADLRTMLVKTAALIDAVGLNDVLPRPSSMSMACLGSVKAAGEMRRRGCRMTATGPKLLFLKHQLPAVFKISRFYGSDYRTVRSIPFNESSQNSR